VPKVLELVHECIWHRLCKKTFHALIRGRMPWKYELETRGGHYIVRETNARFQLRDAILTCNFVMVLLGPLRIVS